MRVVFLDIDGVCNFWGWHAPDLAKVQDYWTGRCLEPQCVEALNEFVHETQTKIVISSSWRGHSDYVDNLPALVATLREGGVTGDIIGTTPHVYKPRGHEIQLWLEDHPEVTHYVALDDEDFDMKDLGGHFVKTDHRTGFTKSDAVLAKKALEIPR